MNVYTENQASYGPTWDAVNAPLICASAVSWSAVMAGAAVAAAFALIMLMLGSGLGLASVFVSVHADPGAPAFGRSTLLWASATAVVASAAGGYVSGRMRTKWIAVSNNEKHFRDTAHGLLAWAAALLMGAVLWTQMPARTDAAAPGRVSGASIQPAASADAGALGYYIDSLFRSELPTAHPPLPDRAAQAAQRAAASEIRRIFMVAIAAQALPFDDMQHAAQLVSRHGGIAQQVAEDRVNDAFARIRQQRLDIANAAQAMAERARKTSAIAALWLVIALLSSAFVASMAATYGGRQRDA